MSKTLVEKLEAARAQVAKLEAAIRSEAIMNNIQPGDDVSFKFGRGEKARVLNGIVVAVADVERQGLTAAIQTGEGIDVQTLKVRVADITENRTAEGREPTLPEGVAEADADPLTAAE